MKKASLAVVRDINFKCYFFQWQNVHTVFLFYMVRRVFLLCEHINFVFVKFI